MILAHGVGRIYQLPIPLSLYLFGAAGAVLASFAVQVITGGRRQRAPRKLMGARGASAVTIGASSLGLVWLGLTVAFAFIDPDPGFTVTPLLFWVGLIVVSALVCAVVGGLWERANPWVTLERFYRLDPDATNGSHRTPPSWLGPLLVYALFWFELATGQGFDPGTILVVVAAYSVYALNMQARYGESWALADPLSIIFGFASRSAPLEIDDEGVEFRGFVSGLVRDDPMPVPLFASVFILLASTTLDNVKETVQWSDFLRVTGLDSVNGVVVVSGALALLTLPFLLSYVVTIVVARRWAQDMTISELARRLGWSLAPIGVAYVLAHNMPLLIVGFPAIIEQLFRAVGANLFHDYVPSPKLVWFLEIGLIVGGHVLGVLSAHRLAVRVTGSPRDATKSHIALTVLMSVFTITTLFLLSQPLVGS